MVSAYYNMACDIWLKSKGSCQLSATMILISILPFTLLTDFNLTLLG
jgi:uncharacterized membrane protein YwzB